MAEQSLLWAEISWCSAWRTRAPSELRVTLLCNPPWKHVLEHLNSIAGKIFLKIVVWHLPASWLTFDNVPFWALFSEVFIACVSTDSESGTEGPYLQLCWLSISFWCLTAELVVISESSSVYFCDFMVGFTAELLRKENTHLHAAKHRQGARSVLLQYLISVRQTSFWKELMFLSIQFWFTVQHFPHSNTLGKS